MRGGSEAEADPNIPCLQVSVVPAREGDVTRVDQDLRRRGVLVTRHALESKCAVVGSGE